MVRSLFRAFAQGMLMMSTKNLFATVICALCALIASSAHALPIPVTIDFSTDDSGATLVNGQAIYTTARADRDGVAFSTDTVLEFGNLVSISDSLDGASSSHLGPVIFDSDPNGPNAGSQDPDLLVDLGNVLTLQSDNPGNADDTTLDGTNGLLFDNPNDEADLSDNGSIIFDFLVRAEPTSIDIVDANGGFGALLTLLDGSGNTRSYTIPQNWTYDINSNPSENGFATLDLTSLAPQTGERTATTSAAEDAGFNPANVVRLTYSFTGQSGGTTSTLANRRRHA